MSTECYRVCFSTLRQLRRSRSIEDGSILAITTSGNGFRNAVLNLGRGVDADLTLEIDDAIFFFFLAFEVTF